jgi:predicted KAP-like P-loop ATPase
MIVADNETAVDLLYYEAIAKTVVRLVSEKSDEPLSVGVHGDWGAGKSSVLMMVEEAFSNDDRVLCVRFNGWLFEPPRESRRQFFQSHAAMACGSRDFQ